MLRGNDCAVWEREFPSLRPCRYFVAELGAQLDLACHYVVHRDQFPIAYQQGF
jgi:hypothetical protein